MMTPQHDAQPFLTTRWTRVCLAKEESDDGLSRTCVKLIMSRRWRFCAASCVMRR